VVGRSDILGSCSDPQHSLRLESRHSRQQTISHLCGVLGNQNAIEQLEEPDRRLCQNKTRRPYVAAWILRTYT
jgi:hypothetical protein